MQLVGVETTFRPSLGGFRPVSVALTALLCFRLDSSEEEGGGSSWAGGSVKLMAGRSIGSMLGMSRWLFPRERAISNRSKS